MRWEAFATKKRKVCGDLDDDIDKMAGLLLRWVQHFVRGRRHAAASQSASRCRFPNGLVCGRSALHACTTCTSICLMGCGKRLNVHQLTISHHQPYPLPVLDRNGVSPTAPRRGPGRALRSPAVPSLPLSRGRHHPRCPGSG